MVKHGNRKWLPLFIMLFTLVLLFVRYADLGEPELCQGDEALTAVRSLSLLDEGRFWTPHWNGTVNLHKPPMYYWLVAVSYLAFGVNELAVRIPSVICLCLLFVTVYKMLARLFSRSAGALAAALLSFHPVLIGQSRVGMMDTLVVLLFVLSGYALYLAGKEKRYFYWWGATCGAALLTKGGGAVACVPASLLYLLIAERSAFKDKHFYLGFLLLLLMPGLWFVSQYAMNKEALFNTYFSWEVGYRLSGHNVWQTFCSQKTTIRLLRSFGSLAPLAFASMFFVFLVDRDGRSSRRWASQLIFLHIMCIVSMLGMNLVKQQMYWYIIPGVVPLIMLMAAVLWAVLAEKFTVSINFAVCLILLGGTFISEATEAAGDVLLWSARGTCLIAALMMFAPDKARNVRQCVFISALCLVVYTGMSFDNKHVNMVKTEPMDDVKALAKALPPSRNRDKPIVVDFKNLPMNALLWYSKQTAVQVDNIEGLDLKHGEVLYGVLRRVSAEDLSGYRVDVMMKKDRLKLVAITVLPSKRKSFFSR